jgi:CDP-glucose 4,6-dehydratase
MKSLAEAYSGRRVFVTGHTGFKGSWLCAWLLDLGADVTGFSLPPPTRPALFTQLRLASRVTHIVGDVRDAVAIARAVSASRPEILFHLAAQPIVQSAQRRPLETWATNVMGTVNVLEALRKVPSPCAAVIVTTDKVYARSPRANDEFHALGSSEPYGASKAAAELAVEAWRESFFAVPAARRAGFPAVAVATARAGNAIGGGDWAVGRLVPDLARAFQKGAPVMIRNPDATRPWQHVLDPLAGYLLLGARLRWALTSRRASALRELSGPFNFGPASGGHRPVRDVVTEIARHWPGAWSKAAGPRSRVEAADLRLDAGKARRLLGWRPKWRFETAVRKTAEWYREVGSGKDVTLVTKQQLEDYQG